MTFDRGLAPDVSSLCTSKDKESLTSLLFLSMEPPQERRRNVKYIEFFN